MLTNGPARVLTISHAVTEYTMFYLGNRLKFRKLWVES